MPKIRGIKPDFWTDEDIVELSIPARLMFMGLWTYACDNGHLQDKSKQIKMRLFPGDDINASELLRELEQNGRIVRKDGWIVIPKFTEHQKPDKRYFQTCDRAGCRSPKRDSQPETRGANHEPTTSPRVDSTSPPGDGDGDGEVKVMVKGDAKRRATTIPDDWQPTEAHRAVAAEERVDCLKEARKFRDSAASKDRRYVDWDAAFRNWLRSPYADRTSAPLAVVSDPSHLPPVEASWMERR